MKRFPANVCRAMAGSGAAATCVPVRLDGGAWEAAFFLMLAGRESGRDRRALGHEDAPLGLGIETELIEHEQAAIAVLRLEIETLPGDPLIAEVLLVPGEHSAHFDALKLLTRQPRLAWFFGDAACNVLRTQRHPLGPEHHVNFDSLLRNALQHDALIRCTGRYDAGAALAQVAAHYELREGVMRSEYAARPGPPWRPSG